MRSEKEIEAEIEELRDRLRKVEGCDDGILYWNIKGKLKVLEWVRGERREDMKMRKVLEMKPKYIQFVVENIEEEIEYIRKRLDSSDKEDGIYSYLQGMMDAYENVLSQLTEEDRRR